MSNEVLQSTKKLIELTENIKIYELKDPTKIKSVLEKINITAKDVEYLLKNDKIEKAKIPSTRQVEEEYLKSIKLTRDEVKKFAERIKKQKKTKEKLKVSETYKTTFYAKISNFFMENLSFALIKKYPEKFKTLFYNLIAADIRILSQTYLSIILFSTIIALPLGFLITFAATFDLLISILVAIVASILIYAITFYYPDLAKTERGKKIRDELVFAIVHMSAVAGSGAHPTRIFELLLASKEYKAIQGELQRILNYINLFGYSLSASLRMVAHTTPSNRLKELLHGMSSTIETGGSMKDYLKEKSSDALIQYKFDQKKQLEAISTYSDVYTGILIAAPLLFIVTLAILEKISPELGGVSIGLIANISVFVALPLLNLAYIFFLNSMRSQI